MTGGGIFVGASVEEVVENAGGVSKWSAASGGEYLEGAGGSNKLFCSQSEGLVLPSDSLPDRDNCKRLAYASCAEVSSDAALDLEK